MTERNSFDRFRQTFDIEDPAFAEQFEDVLDYLMAQCPVAHSEIGAGYYVFNRYQDVRRCAADWRTFSSTDGWLLNPPEGNLPIARMEIRVAIEEFLLRIPNFELEPGVPPQYESGQLRTMKHLHVRW